MLGRVLSGCNRCVSADQDSGVSSDVSSDVLRQRLVSCPTTGAAKRLCVRFSLTLNYLGALPQRGVLLKGITAAEEMWR